MSGFYGGVDAGSWNTKAAVIDAGARVLGVGVVRTGADIPGAAESALGIALRRAGMEQGQLDGIWSTGFGRRAVSFATGSRTELDCHARGVAHYVKGPLTIVDIGGQDAKVIRLDHEQRRIAQRMNRKCAAGTGSFLEEIALRLGIRTDELPALASSWSEEFELGSFCTVFTGTELLAAIREGRRPEDLSRAAYRSLVRRVLEMDVIEGRVVATGGVVAHHPMVVTLLGDAIGQDVIVPPHPQEAGAFGAALAARETSGVAPAGGIHRE